MRIMREEVANVRTVSGGDICMRVSNRGLASAIHLALSLQVADFLPCLSAHNTTRIQLHSITGPDR